MKKQFFRVKQLADQTLLRADRSESLNNDELKKADGKVEYIYKVLSELNKKLPKGNEGDKRKIKYYEYNLGSCMQKLCSDEEHTLLQTVLTECSKIEITLAEEQAQYDSDIETFVNLPITSILEKDFPNIFKQKKNLNKYILDKDSATNRYQSASKNGIQKENLKDDMDEADVKVDQSRDSLATEMFGLLKRENEISMYLLQLLKLQSSYHDSALKTLARVIPKLEAMIGTSEVKPIFGCDLSEHLRVSGRKIAFPLELCVMALTELGMSEEGLFRIAGGASKVKRLKLSIDSACFSLPLIDAYKDVHMLASTLKSYLRELPEPLLTNALYDDWMIAAKEPEETRLLLVQNLVERLPVQNRENLAYLVKFLSKLSKHPENKMTPSNIAIVIAPNLLWSQVSSSMGADMKNCVAVNAIVESLVTNCDSIFPEDISNYASLKPEDVLEVENFVRPMITSLQEHHVDTNSPKPTVRKKTKPAPAPPPPPPPSSKTVEDNTEHEVCGSPYPSGSSTLNRVSKTKIVDGQKSKEDPHEPKPKSPLVTVDSSKMADHKYTTQTTNVQVTKSKPVLQATPQVIENKEAVREKPIAAPRSIGSIGSTGSIDIDGEQVPLRRMSREELEKPNKPAIPQRPASLRSALPRHIGEPDPALHKTSVYSVPHKQQPSLVNIRSASGHDNQMAEKEKFLGHQPSPRTSLENKFNDINSNVNEKFDKFGKPEVPVKPSVMKSTEKLHLETEKINGNNRPGHARTRSDGNIVDLSSTSVGLCVPPPASPKSLNKPSQPPPPPPTQIKKPETTEF